MKARSLFLSVLALIALVAPLAHANDPAPPAAASATATATGTATAASGAPAVRLKSDAVTVTLDKQPILRVRMSFDNTVTGAHADVEWDPARTMSLTQIVRLPKASGMPPSTSTNLDNWSVSLWAEPTLLTAANKPTFLVLKGDPQKLGDVLLPELKQEKRAEAKKDGDNPSGEEKKESKKEKSKEELAKEELAKKAEASLKERTALDQICKASEGHWKGYDDPKNKGRDKEKAAAEIACRLNARIRDGLTAEKSTSDPVQELSVKVRPSGDSANSSGARVALFTATPAALGSGARAADPISGVAAELLQVIAEIAVDRAKSRGLVILKERIEDAVCKNLRWTAELRGALHLADASLDDQPLLPGTCDVVRHIRIEEISSSTKGIYGALMGDLAGIGMKAFASVAQQSVLGKDAAGQMFISLLQNQAAIATFLQQAPGTFDLAPLLRDIEPLLRDPSCEPKEGDANPCKKREELSPALLTAVRADVGRLAQGVSDAFRLFPLCENASDCSRISRGFAALATELQRPVSKLTKTQPTFDLAKARAAALEALSALKALLKTPTFDGLMTQLGGDDEQQIYTDLGKILSRVKGAADAAITAAKELKDFAETLHEGGLNAVLTEEYTTSFAKQLAIIAKFPGLSRLVPPVGVGTYEQLQVVLKYIEKVGKLAIQVAEGGLPADRAAQALLAELAGEEWAKSLCGVGDTAALAKKPECRWACGVEAGFAILGPCAEPGGTCSPASIAHDITHINEVVEDSSSGACKVVFDTMKDQVPWAKIEDVLLLSMEILHPRPDSTPRTLALSALRITFDLLDARFCSAGQKDLCEDLTDAREITVSLVEEQPSRTLVASGKLIGRVVDRAVKSAGGDPSGLGKHKKALMNLTAIIGAFTAYAATYVGDAKGDEQKIKEQHEARRKAIEGLIDATTERVDRGGEWVFSLGVAPGFDLVSAQLKTGQDTAALWPQLSLPMGLAVQELPRIDPDADAGVGFHFQLSPIDLAQFVSYDDNGKVSDPSWGSAFTVSAQFGLLVGIKTPRDCFVIGPDIRYSPTLFPKDGDVTKGAGALRIGLFAAYYVPLFDFN